MRVRDFSTGPRAHRGGLVLGLLGALSLVIAAQQAKAARSELYQVQSRVQEARQDLGRLRDRLKGTSARPAPDRPAIRRALAASANPPARVLRDLVALMPPGVRFEHLELTYGREVEIQGLVVARRVADYDEFLDRLALSSRFASVQPGPETRQGELRATLRATYGVGAPR